MVMLPAVEVTANGPHTLRIGATDTVHPHEDRQAVVDAIRDELERIEGYTGIEVYDGVIEHHPGAPTATDRWDQLLSAGHRVWGFANDGSHRPWETIAVETADADRIRLISDYGVVQQTVAGRTATFRVPDQLP